MKGSWPLNGLPGAPNRNKCYPALAKYRLSWWISCFIFFQLNWRVKRSNVAANKKISTYLNQTDEWEITKWLVQPLDFFLVNLKLYVYDQLKLMHKRKEVVSHSWWHTGQSQHIFNWEIDSIIEGSAGLTQPLSGSFSAQCCLDLICVFKTLHTDSYTVTLTYMVSGRWMSPAWAGIKADNISCSTNCV